MKKKFFKIEKGITLVALVITIIILLILAGVTISLVIGENGLISKSKMAVGKYNDKEKIEKAQLEEFEVGMNLKEESGENEKIDNTPGVLSGEGTEKSPYLIESIEDLVAFSNNVNSGNSYEGKYINLNRNLDFQDKNSYCDADKVVETDINGINGCEPILIELTTGSGFITIGDETNIFKGRFNANSKKIDNIYMNVNTSENKNLAFIGVNNGTIENLSISGNIGLTYEEDNGLVSGIVGKNYGNIEKCHSSVNLKVELKNGYSSYVGGIAAANEENGKITFCKNSGKIENNGKFAETAGIAADNKGVINQSFNKGEIIGNSPKGYSHYEGGIAATNTNIIKNSSNDGKVSGYYTGGILGANGNNSEKGYVYNVYNNAEITGIYSGGIIGENRGELKNCYNKGNIIGKDSTIGSVVGSNETGIQIGEITDAFYLEGTNDKGIGTGDSSLVIMKNESKMKEELINLLNNIATSQKYDNWKTSESTGYPILDWQNNDNL